MQLETKQAVGELAMSHRAMIDPPMCAYRMYKASAEYIIAMLESRYNNPNVQTPHTNILALYDNGGPKNFRIEPAF